MTTFLLRLFAWLLAGVLLPGCAPKVRYGTESESTAFGLVLRVRHLSVPSGGELLVRNMGPRPCFLARPAHCSVFVRLGDAQHRPLNHRPVDTTCKPGDPGQAVRLNPGDSIRYALDTHAGDYRADDLPNARTFEVVYQGTVSAVEWDAQRPRRFTRHTFKASGTLD